MIKSFKIFENLNSNRFTFAELTKLFPKRHGTYDDADRFLKRLFIGNMVSFPSVVFGDINSENRHLRINAHVIDVRVNFDSQIIITDDKGKTHMGRYSGGDRKDLIVTVSNSDSNPKFKKIENPDVDPYGEEDWGWEIQENVSHQDIDPYGEENWNSDKECHILPNLIKYINDGEWPESFKRFIGRKGIITEEHSIKNQKYPGNTDCYGVYIELWNRHETSYFFPKECVKIID